MNTLHNLIIVVQVLSALAIIGLVLLQHGKGADMGAAFGSGASGSLFGASGSSNFMSKSTAVAAAIFFAATLGLSSIATQRPSAGGGVMERVTLPVPAKGSAAIPTVAPAAPVDAAAAAAAAGVPAATSAAPAPAAAAPAASVPAPATQKQ